MESMRINTLRKTGDGTAPGHGPEQRPVDYGRPQLKRWGTLRELTAGGGGVKNEPATKRDTRF
jgi:hypothetical protein